MLIKTKGFDMLEDIVELGPPVLYHYFEPINKQTIYRIK